MKRTFWFAVAAVALAAMVTIPLTAHPQQAGQGPGLGRGMGQGMGMGPGGPGRGPGGPMGVLRQLNLTAAQRDQIKAIMEAERPDERPGQKVVELQKQLQLAIFADVPDEGKLAEVKAAIAAAEAEALAHRVATQTKVAQVLTADQRAAARQLLEQGPRGRGRW